MIWVESANEHPSVTLAKQHIAVQERYEAMREREPEPDLKAAIAELAHLIAIACDIEVATTRSAQDRMLWRSIAERAKAVREALA